MIAGEKILWGNRKKIIFFQIGVIAGVNYWKNLRWAVYRFVLATASNNNAPKIHDLIFIYELIVFK